MGECVGWLAGRLVGAGRVAAQITQNKFSGLVLDRGGDPFAAGVWACTCIRATVAACRRSGCTSSGDVTTLEC